MEKLSVKAKQLELFSLLEGSDRIGASVRIPFPQGADSSERTLNFVKKIKDAIGGTIKSLKICRLGLSAINFEERSKDGGITAFFMAPDKEQVHVDGRKGNLKMKIGCADAIPPIKEGRILESVGLSKSTTKLIQDVMNSNMSPKQGHEKPATQFLCDSPEEICDDKDLLFARRLQASYDTQSDKLSNTEKFSTKYTSKATSIRKIRNTAVAKKKNAPFTDHSESSFDDKDLSYARRLQASYDRENDILTCVEKATEREEILIEPLSSSSKKRRIDTYFVKKK